MKAIGDDAYVPSGLGGSWRVEITETSGPGGKIKAKINNTQHSDAHGQIVPADYNDAHPARLLITADHRLHLRNQHARLDSETRRGAIPLIKVERKGFVGLVTDIAEDWDTAHGLVIRDNKTDVGSFSLFDEQRQGARTDRSFMGKASVELYLSVCRKSGGFTNDTYLLSHAYENGAALGMAHYKITLGEKARAAAIEKGRKALLA